jgi:sugar phosphate permease
VADALWVPGIIAIIVGIVVLMDWYGRPKDRKKANYMRPD